MLCQDCESGERVETDYIFDVGPVYETYCRLKDGCRPVPNLRFRLTEFLKCLPAEFVSVAPLLPWNTGYPHQRHF